MKRYFKEWLSTFRPCIADYCYYCDFDKINRNVDSIKIELNILNSLVGSKNIEQDFEDVITKYPETLKCLPLLLAVRANEISVTDNDGEYNFSFNKLNYSIDEYKMFMRKTKLFDLLENHIVSNLVDYATGVETGLDSNGRKNRGGHLMENLVESYIQKAGFEKNKNYFKEMYIHEIEKKWNVDLSAISNQGKMEKRFDFVIKTNKQIYVVETNFYSSGGSKLNETARSYKTLAQEVTTIDGVTFVWFTDGCGWTSARHNLEETFDVLDTVYNIQDLEQGISNFITNYETLRSIYYRELAKTQKITTEEIIIDHPFIPNLDNIVKNIIVDNIGGLLNKLTQLIINTYILELSNSKIEKIMSNDKNLNQALEVLYKNNLIHKNSELRTFVDNSYRKFLTRLIKIRNKMEHSSKKQNVEIINFYIQPNSSWGNPYWIINIPDYQGNYFLIDELECIYLDFINFIQEFIQIFIKEKFRF